MSRVGAVSVFASLCWMACEPRPQEHADYWSEGDVVSERTFLPADMHVEWSIGGNGDDTLLMNPRLLSAGLEGVSVWDEGRRSIVRISPQGTHLWSFGRSGRGPGEYRSVQSIAHLPDGGVATLDRANRRLSVIDRYGKMVAETSWGSWHSFSVAAMPTGGLVVVTDSPDFPFLLVDDAGVVLDSLAFPWESYRDLPMMARQGIAVGVSSGWVFGFIAGNGWWHFRGKGDDTALAFPYAEHTKFPATVTSITRSTEGGQLRQVLTTRLARPVSSAKGLGVRGDTLFVHFNGRTDHRRRVLDLFDTTDGTYYGSIRLPRRADRVAIAPDGVYTLHADPFPVITRITFSLQNATPSGADESHSEGGDAHENCRRTAQDAYRQRSNVTSGR